MISTSPKTLSLMIQSASKLISYWFDRKFILFSIALTFLTIAQGFSQCPLPPAPGWSNDPSYCGATSVTLKVTTYASGISGHKWYTSQYGSTEISPTSQGNPPGYYGAWTSE